MKKKFLFLFILFISNCFSFNKLIKNYKKILGASAIIGIGYFILNKILDYEKKLKKIKEIKKKIEENPSLKEKINLDGGNKKQKDIIKLEEKKKKEYEDIYDYKERIFDFLLNNNYQLNHFKKMGAGFLGGKEIAFAFYSKYEEEKGGSLRKQPQVNDLKKEELMKDFSLEKLYFGDIRDFKGDYSSNKCKFYVEYLRYFFNYINSNKDQSIVYLKENGEKIKFREDIFIDIFFGNKNHFTISGEFLNRQLDGFQKSVEVSKQNKENDVWAISQPVLVYSDENYEEPKKGEEVFPKEVILVSIFGIKTDVIDKKTEELINLMFKSILNEVINDNFNGIKILCMASIGTGIFGGNVNLYSKVFYEVLSKYSNNLEEKNVYILFNDCGIKEFKEFFDINENIYKFLKFVKGKDVFNIPERIVNDNMFNIRYYLLNPSNKDNLISVAGLGDGGGGEGNIGYSTSVQLNKHFNGDKGMINYKDIMRYNDVKNKK